MMKESGLLNPLTGTSSEICRRISSNMFSKSFRIIKYWNVERQSLVIDAEEWRMCRQDVPPVSGTNLNRLNIG